MGTKLCLSLTLTTSPHASVARHNLLPARLNSSVTTKRQSPSASHRLPLASVSSVHKKSLDLHWHKYLGRLSIINARTMQIFQLILKNETKVSKKCLYFETKKKTIRF